MYTVTVDGAKFIALRDGTRKTDMLHTETPPSVGDVVYYSTYDESLENEKLVKKVVGDVSKRAANRYRVTFQRGF